MSINIVAPNAQAPAGHDEKMIAAVDSANAAALAGSNQAPAADPAPAGEAATPERPAWLPEKFATVEDMAKAYAELEGKASTPESKPAEGVPADPKAAAEAVGAESYAKFNAEFAEKGALSPESYAELEGKGFSKEMVDVYVNGLKASVEVFQTSVQAEAGGAEGFKAMAEWASKNASDEQLKAYNDAVNSGNIELAKLATKGLTASFQAASPAEPRLVNGTQSQGPSDVYESNAQMMADMRKPEYKTDPAFRAKVSAKLGRSNIM